MTHSAEAFPSMVSGLELFDIRSNRQFPRHTHDQFGIGVMLSGGHKSWSGRGQIEAGPGQVITVNPNEVHDGAPLGDTIRRWQMMFVDPYLIRHLCGDSFENQEITSPVMDDPQLRDTFTAVLRAIRHQSETAALENLADMCGQAFRGKSSIAPVPARSREVVHMLEYIHDNPTEAPNLDDLAAVSGLTKATAVRWFRREVGMTSSAYSTQLRVRKARAAIVKGASLTDAALIAGFADQSHMTRAFSRQYGLPPGKWRRMQSGLLH